MPKILKLERQGAARTRLSTANSTVYAPASAPLDQYRDQTRSDMEALTTKSLLVADAAFFISTNSASI